jgi:uncharacterized Zn finger protein (UPF0148 family)
MVPEISHRCPACGVSLRDFGEGVMFCPECGKPLADSQRIQGGEAEENSTDTPAVASAANATMRSDQRTTDPSITTDKNPAGKSDERASARERTRETLQRASQRTRGAIEDNVKRVEKIHHASSAMLEEATYDPSLRFVLVALGLFILFIALLVLSKVMG